MANFCLLTVQLDVNRCSSTTSEKLLDHKEKIVKLVYCQECGDLLQLDTTETKYCTCGDTGGNYLEDGLNAIYWGKFAIPVGIDNGSFAKAILLRPENGIGEVFETFVIPRKCPTFRKIEDK